MTVSSTMLLVGVALYFLPTFIAFVRRVRNAGSVLVVDLFLGWTLVGWVVALAMAVRSSEDRYRSTY
ncbi:superinfection immunity protein [Streptomyces sp. NPDC049881]|uniref:superinfection immunity protein n=1 Tax=unclassified Streptomyces TaxID=2593676 RepID=UPI003421C328